MQQKFEQETRMKPKIGALTIEGYRSFRHLQINGLGRVNLITGKNNTGKSSVLEALRILASDGSPAVLHSILRYREEDISDEEIAGQLAREDAYRYSTLFNGFPEFSSQLKPIEISTNASNSPLRLVLEAAWFSEEPDEGGTRRLVLKQGDLFGEREAFPGLIIKVAGGRRMLPFGRIGRYYRRPPWIRPDITDKTSLPCVFVSPYGGEQTATLGNMWDKIALSEREEDVVEALRIIDPEISAVSMIGGEGVRARRTAIVRADNLPCRVPLRSFGDGLNRLFGIILSLVSAKDGLLLVDEFENGMHHTVQLDVWRAIFRLAQKLDIQVFATSHSWDSIEAFQKAASETPEDGVLVRLSRKGEDIVATLFSEEELAVVARERIEVR